MKKVQWNKVTWYSKAIALVLFVALPFVGFWYGIQTGQLIELAKLYGAGGALQNTTSTVGQSSSSNYYQDVAEWQTDSRFDGGFSIAYPIDFTADDNFSVTPTTDWRLDANDQPGLKFLTITIPAAFEPQTNFADATLTVGDSANNLAIQDCMMPDAGGPPASTTTEMINGIQFYVFTSSDAGAGNRYDTTSYRTLHAGACYAIEYTIHSSELGNYPSQYNLQQFNEGEVTSVLNRIVGTFQF